jgi:hypothetical protein
MGFVVCSYFLTSSGLPSSLWDGARAKGGGSVDVGVLPYLVSSRPGSEPSAGDRYEGTGDRDLLGETPLSSDRPPLRELPRGRMRAGGLGSGYRWW